MARDRTGEQVERPEVITSGGSMLDRINTGADLSPDEAHEAIVARIMSAETVAGVLAEQEVTHSADILDVPIMLEAVHFNESTIEDPEAKGPGFYAILQAVRTDTGEKLAVSCGGRTVLAQLFKLAELPDGLPAAPVAIVLRKAAKPTKRGYYPLWLRAA